MRHSSAAGVSIGIRKKCEKHGTVGRNCRPKPTIGICHRLTPQTRVFGNHLKRDMPCPKHDTVREKPLSCQKHCPVRTYHSPVRDKAAAPADCGDRRTALAGRSGRSVTQLPHNRSHPLHLTSAGYLNGNLSMPYRTKTPADCWPSLRRQSALLR